MSSTQLYLQTKVPYNPVLITVGELPESHSHSSIEKLVGIESNLPQNGSTQWHISLHDKNELNSTGKLNATENSFNFGSILSIIQSHLQPKPWELTDIGADDDDIKQYFEKLRCLYENSDSKSQASIGPESADIRIWNIGLNNIALPFFQCFIGQLSMNNIWLFLDLNRDLANLHLPPAVKRTELQWRSRIQYLLRFLFLSNESSGERITTSPCHTIFAWLHDCDFKNSAKLALKEESLNVAGQMQLPHKLENFVTLMKDSETDENAECMKSELNKCLKEMMKDGADKMSYHRSAKVSEILFQGFLQFQEASHMTFDEFSKLASKFDIQHPNTFCKQYSAYGILLDPLMLDDESKKESETRQIITRPEKFVQDMLEMFQSQALPSNLKPYGIVQLESQEDTLHFKGMFRVLEQCELAVPLYKYGDCWEIKLEKQSFPGLTRSQEEECYYVPFLRSEYGQPDTLPTPGAIQIKLGIQCKQLHLDTAFFESFNSTAQIHNYQLTLSLSTNPNNSFLLNVIRQTRNSQTSAELTVTFHGDITEFYFTPDSNTEIVEKLCESIVSTMQEIAKHHSRLGNVKFQFRKICNGDKYSKMSYNNIFHLHHTLPITDGTPHCNKKCCFKDDEVNRVNLHSWNKVLKTTKTIEGHFLITDVMDDREINKIHGLIINMDFPPEADNMLKTAIAISDADESSIAQKDESLEYNSLLKKIKSKQRLLVRIINLDALWKDNEKLVSKYPEVRFNELARKIDAQVFTAVQADYWEQFGSSTEYSAIPRDISVTEAKNEVDKLRNTVCQKDLKIMELQGQLASSKSRVYPSLAEKRNAGIQFNVADLKIEHLDKVKLFRSRIFSVCGEQEHPLVWEGFGFKLYLPKDTFLPEEECNIRVDAVLGGDFVIPEGVEPVSAIYVISASTKLRQSSLLKIQHCVELSRSPCNTRLSFYRASLKESSPPYLFKRVPGGKFDSENKYGELQLPVFCALFIGRNENSSNDECQDEPTQPSPSDDSIMYRGRLVYLQKDINQWQAKFIVAKNLDALNNYVCHKERVEGHEADTIVDFVCTNGHVELIEEQADPQCTKGWKVLPHANPSKISIKRANSFGFRRYSEIGDPPFCMWTISADTKVPDCAVMLKYPITMKNCLLSIENREKATINLIRSSRTAEVPSSESFLPPPMQSAQKRVDVGQVARRITGVLNSYFAALKNLFHCSIDAISAEMFAVNIAMNDKRTAEEIIHDFINLLVFFQSLNDVEVHCGKFFGVLQKLGGPLQVAGDNIKKSITEAIKEDFDFDFVIQ